MSIIETGRRQTGNSLSQQEGLFKSIASCQGSLLPPILFLTHWTNHTHPSPDPHTGVYSPYASIYLFVATSQPLSTYHLLAVPLTKASKSLLELCVCETTYTPKRAHSWVWSLICSAVLHRETPGHHTAPWLPCARRLPNSEVPQIWLRAWVTCNECCAGFHIWGQSLSDPLDWGGQFWKIKKSGKGNRVNFLF